MLQNWLYVIARDTLSHIYWKYVHSSYRCYGFETDFHRRWQWQKTQTQKPCHIYDRPWLGFEGIHSFLEKGSFIWESSSLTRWPRRNVRSYGPFGPIYTVKGVEIHKLAASTLVYPNTQGNMAILIQISWDHGGFLAGSLSKWTSTQSPLVLRNTGQSSGLTTNKAHCNINLLFKLATFS